MFTECEHGGDMNSYIEELHSCGTIKVLHSELNTEFETCAITIEIEYPKWDDFLNRFKKSDLYGFSSLSL